MHLIIDGYNLAFRSHFAHSTLCNSSGLASGGVYGFLVSLRALKNKYPHCHVTIAWDSDSTRRKQVFADYKANRPKFILGEQISDLISLFYGVNVAQAKYVGEEADDVIASLTLKNKDTGLVYIYTSDKDLLQLVEDGKVILIRPKTASGPERIYDEEAVKNEFGVLPKDLACYMSFRGDAVDNVPGVARLPSSVISSLSSKYKNPWAVYEHLTEEKLTDFQRTSIVGFQQQVYVNYGLVSLRDDLDLELSQGIDNPDVVGKVLDKYEIKSINPESYIKSFIDRPSNMKTSPALECYSLFEV